MNIKKITITGIIATMLLTLSGCTMWEDTMKGWESDTNGLPRIVTIYSKTGEVLKKYEGNSVRISDAANGTMVINLDGKRIQVQNADVIVEEK
ncbi:DUF5052 family protein [Lactococcus muris]|uniref:DUF5052 family protein n=1 Tax=Lactococcus muris TaxID=2941330 RepID=UPI002300BFB5